jgi:hypothetical protein
MGFTFSPATISYAGVSVVAGATTYPTTAGNPIVWPPAGVPPATNIQFPRANCRQVIILNTGATTIYFGSIFAQTYAQLPGPFNPAGVAPSPVLGQNCTPINAGSSLSIELFPFEKRGQFDPGFSPITPINFEPITIIFFAAAPATNASAVITYINTTGPF